MKPFTYPLESPRKPKCLPQRYELVKGRWADDVDVLVTKSERVLGWIDFKPYDITFTPFSVCVFQYDPRNPKLEVGTWARTKRFVLRAAGGDFESIRHLAHDPEQMIRAGLAGREAWLDISEKKSKEGYPFIHIVPVYDSDVVLASDGHAVVRCGHSG